ncbi:MAG: hypothetical protein EI684_00655 [Candidatus Viridilinea halotolerans]|uniref:Uncharacterized protein n=1 Tax=Candidatus Viridilinea halotolerans TaxID=2491704 RepID=A0A426UBI6_9CHLR|nr:MAG: hypothetical protein EI684_00655 [Candidatus Viridilinea halotolerans]
MRRRALRPALRGQHIVAATRLVRPCSRGAPCALRLLRGCSVKARLLFRAAPSPPRTACAPPPWGILAILRARLAQILARCAGRNQLRRCGWRCIRRRAARTPPPRRKPLRIVIRLWLCIRRRSKRNRNRFFVQ